MKRPTSIKVRINFTLDVNPEAWACNYGGLAAKLTPETRSALGIICRGPEGIVKDVKAHFEGLCREHLAVIGCWGKKTLK